MGGGSYLGGSTIIGPGSGWFSTGRRGKVKQATDVDAHERKRERATIGKKNAKAVRKAKPKKKEAAAQIEPRKGNGLTIPERISRAAAMVGRIENEVRQAEKRLQKLRGQLLSAKAQLEAARNLPRRSAIGIALQKAEADSEAGGL